MFDRLPHTVTPFMEWKWEQIAPFFQDLFDRPLDAAALQPWLADWTRLADLLSERYSRLNVAVTQDTADKLAEEQYLDYLETIQPRMRAADNQLKRRLLECGVEPPGFRVPLRKMRVESEIFREANLPLFTQESKLSKQYDKVVGAQTVAWQGQEITLQALRPLIQAATGPQREQLWRLASQRQLADRPAINALWAQLLPLRQRIAENAGFPDYSLFRWQQMLRLDYTPADCQEFRQAILQVVVPAASRIYERYRQRMGLERLRPWDLDQDLYPIPDNLPSYGTSADLQAAAGRIFERVDPQLGAYFRTMQAENLMDLDNRKGKAPGAYCTGFAVQRRPFIFMNAVGLAADIRTILHETGHAFHNFERLALPYHQQRNPGLEFAEVASMAMELLAAPYLLASEGGFFSPQAAARDRISHLERILAFWPYMAVVDGFQHWAYTHPQQASDPLNCDAAWLELWNTYIPAVDWSGLDDAVCSGWQRKQHILRSPLYYVEYGLAQSGAVQVWRNALQDQAAAVRSYRQALALGGTATLPELYATAGARFAFDASTLAESVSLVESTITHLLDGHGLQAA